MIDSDEQKLLKFGMVFETKTECEDTLYKLEKFDGVEICSEISEHPVFGESRLRIIGDENWIEWKLLELASVTPKQAGVEQEIACYEIVLYGEGPANLHNPKDHYLREPRHTWVPKGYWFYVRPKPITWAFEQLSKWFDY